MGGPVLWGVTPIADEGLMSLVTRTVARNVLPSAHTLLGQVGVANANNPTAALLPELDAALLATILRQPTEEVARRHHAPRPEPGFVDFFGVAIRADEIVFRRRRFGPAAIGESPHARALWSLKMVPCCTERWQYLVDACACGAVQRWQHADRLHRCDVCNASLAYAPTVTVDPALRDGLAFLIGLLDPDDCRRAAARVQLPAALADWNGGMVFELALAVMPLTLEGRPPDRGHEPTGDDLVSHATSLAQAADVVRGWPNSLVPLLVERVRSRSVSKRNVRYTGAAHYVSGLTSDLLPAVVREAFAGTLAGISTSPGTVPEGQIGMREAAALTGQVEHRLAIARRAGQLWTRICLRANRLLPTLDRAEIETLHDFLQHRVGPDRASHRLHLPQYAIRQLAEDGLLKVSEHPYVVTHYGADQVHEDDLAAFRQRLREGGVSADVIVDPVPLHRAARAIGGGPKPWGVIVGRLLDGTIPYAIFGDTIGRISISARDAAALRIINLGRGMADFRGGHVSQRDAIEILNLPLKHAHLLPAGGTPGGSHRIPARRIRHLARTRITLAEMSARTGIHGTRLQSQLESDGCLRRDPFGWRRDEALARIANY